MNFADRLHAAVRSKESACLLGLDPHPELLPPPFAAAADPTVPRADRARAIGDFCCHLVDRLGDRVPAVKPQSAFFELLGADGALAWERVVEHARAKGLLVVADVKRGDIASTATAYAQAHLLDQGVGSQGRADAMTLSPYLGRDTLEPFVETCVQADAGAFVLVRTSNPGSSRYQRVGEPPLAERVAADVVELGQRLMGSSGWSSLGAVVGATHADELAHWRALLPRSILLLPGYGAQGATAKDVVPAFGEGYAGALVASSRGIAFAYRSKGAPADWLDAADRALDAMLADLRGALEQR